MLSGLNLFAQQHWSFHLKSQNIQFYLKIQAIFLKKSFTFLFYYFFFKKRCASLGNDNNIGYKT